MAFHTIPPHTPEWHAMRAKHIGASEVAALLGAEPPYGLTRYTLHHVKSGRTAPLVDDQRVRIGLAIEPVIARLAAEQQGWAITAGRYATDDDCAGLGASLDYEIAAPGPQEQREGCEGPGVLECKSTDYIVWKRTYTNDEPPTHHLLQLQAQMASSGYGWGVLATLVGGNALRLKLYKRRPRIIGHLRKEVAAFWRAVADRKPPRPDGSDGAGHMIRQLFPDLAYEPADLSGNNALPDLCAQYLRAVEDAKEADGRKDELRNQILAEVGPHRVATAQGFTLNVAVTPARAPRAARPDEIIPGRAESRRLTVKERTHA